MLTHSLSFFLIGDAMKRFFMWKFLALLAVSLCSDVATAQRVVNSVNDIPTPGVGEAAAYFDAATGDIYFAIEETVVLFGLDQAPFGFVDGVFDSSAVNSTTPLGAPSQNDSNGIAWLAPLEDANGLGFGDVGFDPFTLDFVPYPSGIYNIGSLLPADPSIQTAADFDALYPDARFSFAIPGAGVRSPLNVVEGSGVFRLITASSVPEPSSLVLLLLAGTHATIRRNRKR